VWVYGRHHAWQDKTPASTVGNGNGYTLIERIRQQRRRRAAPSREAQQGG